jgi:RNA polymerase sigma-70 factor (ECF subfamily)
MSSDFDQIYREVGPGVYRYLRRLTGSRAQAEDLFQEAFFRLHGQLISGAALANYRAWLFQVATNLARDRKRSEMRSALRDETYAASSTIIDFHARLENQQLVRRSLARLTPKMREVLLLFSEGFSYREIANIAEIEAAYVGVLLQRARSAFKRYYREEQGRGHESNSQSSAL